MLLAGCGTFNDLMKGTSRPPEASRQTPADPPADEARICQLARQAVREATGVSELRGDSCTATHAGPGSWQARVEFSSGAERQSWRIDLQPHRQRQQGWRVVDITPMTTSG
jgi:hypothetical protein